MANRYGKTIRTADPFAAETEDDEEILRQWCAHTLNTRKGTVETDPDHGFDLPGLLVSGLTAAQRAAIPAAAKAALERGRKVARAEASLVETNLGGGRVSLALQIEVWPAKGGPAVTFTHPVDDSIGDVYSGVA